LLAPKCKAEVAARSKEKRRSLFSDLSKSYIQEMPFGETVYNRFLAPAVLPLSIGAALSCSQPGEPPTAGSVELCVVSGPAATYGYHLEVAGGGTGEKVAGVNFTIAFDGTAKACKNVFMPSEPETWNSASANVTITEDAISGIDVDEIVVTKNGTAGPGIKNAKSTTVTTSFTDVQSVHFSHVGVDPKPVGSDVIVRDFRAGGNRDIQVCTTLACAIGTSFAGNVSFTTDFDGQGTNAFVLPWQKNGGQASCTGNSGGSQQNLYIFTNPAIIGPVEVFLQYKLWMGRTSTGPGIGNVGEFKNTNSDPAAPGGHKWFVLFRNEAGGSNARMTAEQSPSVGKFITTSYPGFTGTGGLDGSIGEVHFFGSDVATPWNPDDNTNKVNTLTFRFKSESAINAGNGEMSLWVNGVLRQEKKNMFTSPFGVGEWQIGGPTWICPPQDQTAYVWDMVVWRKP
jgi:hypothetical protein